MKYETINDAAHAWVAEFNAIPMAIIDKLLEGNSEELQEITPPSVGDRVFVFNSPADEDTDVYKRQPMRLERLQKRRNLNAR